MKFGLLHPGAMGTSIGAAILAAAKAAGDAGADTEVTWVAAGRSPATRARAEDQGFVASDSLAALAATSDVILSICPPHAAEEVAADVVAAGFAGTYIDANAISPARSLRIGAALTTAKIGYVDGGIIGPPAWGPARTWFYLSGPRATEFTDMMTAGPLTCAALGPDIGTASSLKMCFAAYTKGTTALLSGILATSEALGVRNQLIEQWSLMDMGLDETAPRQVRAVTEKAWRFVGEMEEIAATFADAGLPDGFHAAAADIYRRMAGFKDADGTPELDAVLAALTDDGHTKAA